MRARQPMVLGCQLVLVTANESMASLINLRSIAFLARCPGPTEAYSGHHGFGYLHNSKRLAVIGTQALLSKPRCLSGELAALRSKFCLLAAHGIKLLLHTIRF